MRRLVALAFALLALCAPAHAANEKIVTWGLSAGAEPRSLCVYDTAHNCVPVGLLNATTHTFDGSFGPQRSNNPFGYTLSAAPSSLCNTGTIGTAFNCDLSHTAFPIAQQITGAATLGQPTTGYVYTDNAYPVYGFLLNTSGWNNGTADANGRTAAAYSRVHLYQSGQGDIVAYNAACFVGSTRVGATSFLANPACELFTGDAFAGANSVYLNPYETDLHDQGFGVSGIGNVNNLFRTSVAIPLGDEWWAGYRMQSVGSKAVDVAFSAAGPANIGLDLSFLTLPTSGAGNVPFNCVSCAITMSAGQRIYWNATATDATNEERFPSSSGTTYSFYDTGNAGIFTVVGGSDVSLFTPSFDFLYSPVVMGAALNNRLQVNGGANGVSPLISSTGISDANVDITLAPKGVGNVVLPGGVLLRTSAALTNGAAAQVGTLNNAPAAGNPTKWIPINDNGTTRFIPAW